MRSLVRRNTLKDLRSAEKERRISPTSRISHRSRASECNERVKSEYLKITCQHISNRWGVTKKKKCPARVLQVFSSGVILKSTLGNEINTLRPLCHYCSTAIWSEGETVWILEALWYAKLPPASFFHFRLQLICFLYLTHATYARAMLNSTFAFGTSSTLESTFAGLF